MVVTTGDGRRPSIRSTCLVPSIPMSDTISLEIYFFFLNRAIHILHRHDARLNHNLQMESIFRCSIYKCFSPAR